MSAKAEKIGLKPISKRIDWFYSANIAQMCSKEGFRSSIDLDDESTTKEEVFTHAYFNSKIQNENLPIFSIPKAIYIPQGANFLVGWVNSFLFQQHKEKTTFLSDFVEELEFVDYAVEFKQDSAELRLTLDFEVNY